MQEAGDLKDLYAGLARAVVTAVKADACLISILDDDGETLRDISASVVPPAHLNEIADQSRLERLSASRIVIETMQSSTVSVLDSTADAAAGDRVPERDGLLARDPDLPGDRGPGHRARRGLYASANVPSERRTPVDRKSSARFAMNSYANIRLASRLESHYTETIETLVSTLEARNPDTNAHAKRVRRPGVGLGVRHAPSLRVPPDTQARLHPSRRRKDRRTAPGPVAARAPCPKRSGK